MEFRTVHNLAATIITLLSLMTKCLRSGTNISIYLQGKVLCLLINTVFKLVSLSFPQQKGLF